MPALAFRLSVVAVVRPRAPPSAPGMRSDVFSTQKDVVVIVASVVLAESVGHELVVLFVLVQVRAARGTETPAAALIHPSQILAVTDRRNAGRNPIPQLTEAQQYIRQSNFWTLQG